MSTGVELRVHANLTVEVCGTGRNQTIRVVIRDPAGSVTGHMSGGGPSGSDDLENEVNNEISNQLPDQIARALDIPFDSVSVFALKNLLFPTGNCIRFDACYVPGDLIVLGNFVTDEQ
jgi:hypothetical protein